MAEKDHPDRAGRGGDDGNAPEERGDAREAAKAERGLHAGDAALLEIRVDAAPWVPIAEWRAYVDGELVHRAPIQRGESASLPLAFARDAIVTVEVEGPAEGRYAEVLPKFTPLAFTNPIFVDADRNGRFDAPGLPDPLPDTIRAPHSTAPGVE